MIDDWNASFEDIAHVFEELEHSIMYREPLDWIGLSLLQS